MYFWEDVWTPKAPETNSTHQAAMLDNIQDIQGFPKADATEAKETRYGLFFAALILYLR